MFSTESEAQDPAQARNLKLGLKHEIRSTKHETNSKPKIPMTETADQARNLKLGLKHEIRSTKHETDSKSEIPMTETADQARNPKLEARNKF